MVNERSRAKPDWNMNRLPSTHGRTDGVYLDFKSVQALIQTPVIRPVVKKPVIVKKAIVPSSAAIEEAEEERRPRKNLEDMGFDTGQ
jgi:hypothetical protein